VVSHKCDTDARRAVISHAQSLGCGVAKKSVRLVKDMDDPAFELMERVGLCERG